MNINALVKDWAWRVNDGMPDPKNRNHIGLLEDTLRAYKYSEDFISEYILSITNPKLDAVNFQELCVEIGKILSEENILTEASVYKDKYKVGHTVALNDLGKPWWNKKFGNSPAELTKAAKQDVPEERSTTKGSGATELYLSDGKNVYKITGTAKTMGSMFVHVKDPNAIKWNEETLEAAALAGLYMSDPKALIDGLLSGNESTAAVARKNAIKAITSAIKSGMRNGSGITSKLNTCSLPDIIQALELANGMHIFASKFGCKGWNFIHDKITDFYDAHDANPKLKIGGSKVPTPDCVIVQGSPGTLIKNLEKDGVKWDAKGKCTTDSGDVFFQISCKKSAAGAQLGRITGLVKDRYGLQSWSDATRFMVYEDIKKYENHEFLLNEGFVDYFKKGITYLKDKFTQVFQKIKSKVQGIGSAMVSAVKKWSGNTKPADALMRKLSKGFEKTLTEAKKPKLTHWTFAQACVNEFHASPSNPKRFEKLYKQVNSEWKKVQAHFGKSKGVRKTIKTTGPIMTSLPAGNKGANTVIKYFVNYLAYHTMNKMITDSSGNLMTAKKILEDFVELEKEMHFGSSELPIYKVYGTDGNGKAYEYLFSGGEFREKKQSVIDEFGSSDIPGVVIESNLQSAGYTNNSMYILNDFTEKGPTYTQLALRSSGDDSLTFSVQGSTVRTWESLKKKVQ